MVEIQNIKQSGEHLNYDFDENDDDALTMVGRNLRL